MMTLTKFEHWLQTRSTREKTYLYVLGFVLIYLLWHILLNRPLQRNRVKLIEKQKALAAEIITVKSQIAAINAVVADPIFKEKFSTQQKLSEKAKTAGEYLNKLTPKIIPLKDINKAVADILATQGNIVIQSVKHLPTEAWIPKELNDIKLASYFKEINKYTLDIIFQGTYFDTIAYIERLEKLPWNIYWESMSYKVLKYPVATVEIKLYLLTNHADE